MRMNQILPLLIVLIQFFGNTKAIYGADFQKGVEAYNNSDYLTALREWAPLGKDGDADVQYNLGVMYDLGQGVPKDYKIAAKWYKLASEQGHANAQAALGQMHQKGEGVPKNLIRAYMWISIAVSAGVKYADEAKDILVKNLSSSEIITAQKLARECVRKGYKKC